MKTFDTYFTHREEKQLLATVAQLADVKARRDHAWMVLARHTAVRVCVLSGLTVGDALDAIRRERLVIRPEINKRSKQQDLFCSKKVLATLRTLVKIHREMSHEEDWPDTAFQDRPLILSRKRQGMSIRNFQDRMKHWTAVAGVPAGTPHWWRHTWAKRQLEGTEDVGRALMRIQLWLGHDDPKTTFIYTMPDREEMADFARMAR